MKRLLTILLLAALALTACANPTPPLGNETTETPTDAESTTPEDSETTMPEDTETTTAEETTSASPDDISAYLTYLNGMQYLILPISKEPVYVSEGFQDQLNNIDLELLKHAEETIFDITNASEEGPPHCFLTKNKSGALCLATSGISYLDPPRVQTTEDGETIASGCNIDHVHTYYDVCIEKRD